VSAPIAASQEPIEPPASDSAADAAALPDAPPASDALDHCCLHKARDVLSIA
jgi:hypothetical protein